MSFGKNVFFFCQFFCIFFITFTSVSTVTHITNVTTVSIVTTVTAFTTLMVKYNILILHCSKGNLFTKSHNQQTDRPTDNFNSRAVLGS